MKTSAVQWMIVIAMARLFSTSSPVLGIEIFYDFEGQAANIAVDRLTGDGSQNGQFLNNVSVTKDNAPFGSQAALFERPVPQQGVPPFSTLEIPDTQLERDFSLTVAMHVQDSEVAMDATRLFSTFQGQGAATNDRSVFLDFDPSGQQIQGLRAIVNSTIVETRTVPAGMADPGFHHYALTVDDGNVSIYFDGAEVGSGFVGNGYSSEVNIQIGEDPHDGGGLADEQLIGNIDDVLVLEAALSPQSISQLADGMRVSDVVTPEAGQRAVYYDFEGGSAAGFTDRFTLDGAQNGIANRFVSVDTTTAKLGSSSARLQHPQQVQTSAFSQIDIGPVGSLGDEFTLSAVVNVPGDGFSLGRLTRLFSSFRGTGGIQQEELVFDFDPDATIEGIAMRLLLPDGSAVTANEPFSTNENHTLTAVYDHGTVHLYLDGQRVASEFTSAGEIDLGTTALKIGEDNGGIVNENFLGVMDDVVVLSRALSAVDVARLSAQGAANVLGLAGIQGDFNGDGFLDVADINQLIAVASGMNNNGAFDLTGDQVVDDADVGFWVTNLKGTWRGDANLDGEFNSADLVAVFQPNKFEQAVAAAWHEGDWTGDQRFDSSDIVAAFQDGGYERGPRQALAVPEPLISRMLGLMLFWQLASTLRRAIR